MEKSMLLISSFWGREGEELPAFRMIPIDKDCPYTEVLFIPKERTLGIVSKTPKKAPIMEYKLDANGRKMPIIEKVEMPDGKKKEQMVGYKMEKLMAETLHEFMISDPTEIKEFITMFAYNVSPLWWERISILLTPPVVPEGEITLAEPEKVAENTGLKVV